MMWAVFEEMERDIISQRVKSGMANAKAKGKRIGRPYVSADNLPEKFTKYLPLFLSGEINKSELAKLSNVTRGTVNNYLKLLNIDKKK